MYEALISHLRECAKYDKAENTFKEAADTIENLAEGGNMTTGGCIKCKKCEVIGLRYYCERTRLTEKQVYNKKGYCSRFEPKKPPKEEESGI